MNIKATSKSYEKVLILGGYGNFGNRIATALVKAGISIIIAGRDSKKAENFLQELRKTYRKCEVEIAIFDIKTDLENQLKTQTSNCYKHCQTFPEQRLCRCSNLHQLRNSLL